MYFLIEYDREHGKVSSLRECGDADATRAAEERLALELGLAARNVQREIVLLQAASLDALKLTHKRYFAALEELAAVSGT
jgi:hypothetical protein